MNESSVAQSPPATDGRAHASPVVWRTVETVLIAERLYQLRARSSRATIGDLPVATRRHYEQAATTALTVLDTLLAHAAEQEGAAS